MMSTEYWNKDLGRNITVKYILTLQNVLYEVVDIVYDNPGYVFITKEGLRIPEYNIQALGPTKGTQEKLK